MITQDDVQQLRNLIQAMNQATVTVTEQLPVDCEEREWYHVSKTLWDIQIDRFLDLANRMETHLAHFDLPYGKWFYPHKGELPAMGDDGFFASEPVIVSYDEGGVDNPMDFDYDYYLFGSDETEGNWDTGRTPWCWMYYPPRGRNPAPHRQEHGDG